LAKKIDVPFNGTKEQEERLKSELAALKQSGGEGLLIAALQKAQEIYGYLPEAVQQMVADAFDVSLAEVYGVATFYAQFSLYPKGRYKVGEVYQKVCDSLKISGGECTDDLKFSLDATRCIGCCGLAPVMTVNDDVYGKVTVDEVESILAKYND